jgi:hypothetical protein
MDECSRAGSVQRFPELVAPFGVTALPVDEERLDLAFASLFAEVFGVRRYSARGTPAAPRGGLRFSDGSRTPKATRETNRGASFSLVFFFIRSIVLVTWLVPAFLLSVHFPRGPNLLSSGLAWSGL